MTKTTSKKPKSLRADRDTSVSRVYMLRTSLVILLIVMAFAVVGGILHFRASSIPQTYRSDFMKVEFTYPSGYFVESDLISVSLSKKDMTNAQINFSRSGTNFRNVQSHVENSISRWKIKPTRRYIQNNDQLAGQVVEQSDVGGRQHKIVYFVKDFFVYQFETNDPALFSDLDTIAKSFRILP